MMNRNFIRYGCFLLLLSVAGCAADIDEEAEQRSADESSSDQTITVEPSVQPSGASFSTYCGVVVDGTLQSPVYESQGERVRVTQVVDPTFLIVHRAAGDQLVQLQGIRTKSPYESAAKAILQDLSAEDAFLFEPGSGCFAQTADGGQGIVAHLVSASGTSYAEELLRAGVVDLNSTLSCSSELVSSCYSDLRGEPPPTSAGEVTDFLWKPQADSSFNPGKLVIHANPCNMRVVVNGEELPDYGSGNGRCITARSQKTGCAYGKNVRVQLFDVSSGLPYTHAGQPFVVVPNGCSRFEFK